VGSFYPSTFLALSNFISNSFAFFAAKQVKIMARSMSKRIKTVKKKSIENPEEVLTTD